MSSPADVPSITAAYPLHLMQLLAARGHDPSPVLHSVALDMGALSAADARVSLAQYASMAMAAMALTGDEGLGCALALRTPPTAHGPLGYAMMTAPTLGDALALGLRYMPLLQGQTPLMHWVDDSHVHLRATIDLPLPQPLKRFFSEALMIGIVRSGRWLLGTERLDCELWFTHPLPDDFAQYGSQLPTVRHGMPFLQLRIAQSALAQALPLADPASHARAVAQCAREASWLMGGEANLCAKVRALLAPNPAVPTPTVDEVASRLHMSVRTLKRKLAQQGSSYRTLVDQARYFEAARLLRRPELALERIAFELGYQDPANFTRAFRRWSGMPPSAFRIKALPIETPPVGPRT